MAKDKRNTAIFTAFEDWDAENIPIPEKSLLRAVLQNAISDMNREGEFSKKARDFFLSRDDDYIFSFQAICSYLHINPDKVLLVVGLKEDICSNKTLEASQEFRSHTSARSEGPALRPRS